MLAHDPQVLIVGAGPVGLTAAVSLSQLGVRCRVVDKAPHAVTESRALGIHARTLEVLERLGVVDRFIAEGIVAQGVRVFSSGHEKVHLSFAQLDTPYPCMLLLEQSRTERLLAEQLAGLGISIERSVEVESLAQDADGVTCQLKLADGRQETCRAPFVVGCDGAHSVVRKQLGLTFDGDVVPGAFLVADTHVDADWRHDEGQIFFSRAGLFVALPISGGRWRLIANLSDDEKATTATMEMVEEVCAERAPAGVRPHDPVWLSLFRINSRVVNRFRVGRVFVAGDAAHVHSPAGGQGMNTGMQDAFNLSWKLAAHLAGRGGDELLESYHQERQPNAKALVEATDRATRTFASGATNVAVLRSAALTLAGKLEVARERVTLEMSELAINYRKSPMSDERSPSVGDWLSAWTEKTPHPSVRDCLDFHAGPRAGDRAPDTTGLCRTAGDSLRLFQCWKGDPRHQVLVFAGASATRERIDALEGRVARFNAAHRDSIQATLIRVGLGSDASDHMLYDVGRAAHERYGARFECVYLVRPDGYVGYRCQPVNLDAVVAHMNAVYGARATQPATHGQTATCAG